ncbi:CBS domain-containing protein [Elongatibacter sediminis]|uniref:CBS domain-containing protein n=1 Tax=Elongatibacter sediminis TaxID=3119006 RepID=A0AAW9R934_9GAMM
MLNLNSIMTTDLVTAQPDATLAEARTLMQEHRIRHLPIVDGDGDFIGLLTQTDVLAATDSFLRSEEQRLHASDIRVEDVMITRIVTVGPGAGLRKAALFLEEHKVGCLPVVEDGRLLGIVTDTDFVGVAINLLETLEESEPVENGFDDEE